MDAVTARRFFLTVALVVLVVTGMPPPAHSRSVAVRGGVGWAAGTGVSDEAMMVGAAGGPRWAWPLNPRPRVVHRFRAPPVAWGAGHRGVDLAAEVGQSVTAVADGTVFYVGVIDGRGTVSVLHASGIRSTYEPVTASVTRGASITRGQVLGVIDAVPGHCAPAACLHLGAIRDRTYLDPLALLTIPKIVLLPTLPG